MKNSRFQVSRTDPVLKMNVAFLSHDVYMKQNNWYKVKEKGLLWISMLALSEHNQLICDLSVFY